MQEALLQLRLALIKAIALQKRTQQQHTQAQAEVDKWQQRVQLALQKGDENLARQAFIFKKSKAETAKALKAQLKQQHSHTLQRQVRVMEENLEQAKTKRDELKARLAVAKAQLKLQSSIRRLSTNSAMGAFERMEEKVLELEACSQAAYELTGNDLEQQIAELESGSDVDDELAQMKVYLASSPKPQEVLPSLQEKASSSSDSAVDEELEALRKQIENI